MLPTFHHAGAGYVRKPMARAERTRGNASLVGGARKAETTVQSVRRGRRRMSVAVPVKGNKETIRLVWIV